MNISPVTRQSIPARHVAAVVAGNALEFYDFVTYAFFAVYIGRAFFPSDNPSSSLLASLGTFGAGFVTRPIGSWVIGRMGDRLGRKPAMVLTFSLMGFAIAGLALTPPHSMIGVAAPALVIFFRLLQGFALGGEVGPTTAFLLEAAPPERRGFYTAFQGWTQHLSILFSGLIGFALASTLTARQLQDFGWRIAFLLGALILPFGVLVRRELPETFHPPEQARRERVSFGPHLRVAIIGVMLLGSATIGIYTLNYLTTYSVTTLSVGARAAFAATIVVGICGVALDLVSGALSDRVGRKPVMLLAGTLLFLTIFPAFRTISHYRNAVVLLGTTAVLSSFQSLAATPMVIWLTESFPAPVRSSGVAVVYAFAIATFGGTTQYVVAWLIQATGNPLAPAWYWSVAVFIGVAATIATRESAPGKTANREALLLELPENPA
jgi:MFS transporter, MHS family, citrate/tricarballylate:H+ symporter